MGYFVTGATGFIGRYLVGNLLKRKGSVHVLVREGSGGVLAYPLVVAAARVLREVATFDDAGVSEA